MDQQKLHKALVVTLIDDEVVVFRGETALRRIFTQMRLPYPNSPKPVLSPEFREQVFRTGFSITMRDDNEVGSAKFIPPSRIKSVDFYIGKKEIPAGKKEFAEFMKKLDFELIFG